MYSNICLSHTCNLKFGNRWMIWLRQRLARNPPNLFPYIGYTAGLHFPVMPEIILGLNDCVLVHGKWVSLMCTTAWGGSPISRDYFCSSFLPFLSVSYRVHSRIQGLARGWKNQQMQGAWILKSSFGEKMFREITSNIWIDLA